MTDLKRRSKNFGSEWFIKTGSPAGKSEASDRAERPQKTNEDRQYSQFQDSI